MTNNDSVRTSNGERPLLPQDAPGLELGTRTISYDERDAILYALAVGAPASELDLVFERDLRVLPTYGLVLGRWAAEELRLRGLFLAEEALHGAQTLKVKRPLPPAGTVEVSARIISAWDKGSAAVFEVETSCEYFDAVATIFARNRGGWGGERGPSAPPSPTGPPSAVKTISTHPSQAALYRLTGDPHLIHIDPEAAKEIGQPRPILHGLCTLAFAARAVSDMVGRRPYEVASLSARFSAPALPGDELTVNLWDAVGEELPFTVHSKDAAVLSNGSISFA